jgi:hypothetical protein
MRSTSLLGPSCFIELIGYELGDPVDPAAFAAAWQAGLAASPRPAGLLQRELCVQRPDWNDKIRAGISEPNPFMFLDYAVFRAAADHAEARRVPSSLPGDPTITTGTFTIASRFVRPEAAGEPQTLLYNLFQVQGGEPVEEAFLARWPERAQYQAQQDGFHSAVLHRQSQPGQRISAFNRGEWLDADHYAATLAGFDRNFPRAERSAAGQPTGGGPPPVRSLLGLFEIVAFA